MQGLMTDHEKALAVDGGQRAQLVADLYATATYLQCHPEAPAPGRLVVNVPAPAGATREARKAFVAGFAATYRVPVLTGPTGCRQASRPFGPFGRVVLEAHTTPAGAQILTWQAVLHGERAA